MKSSACSSSCQMQNVRMVTFSLGSLSTPSSGLARLQTRRKARKKQLQDIFILTFIKYKIDQEVVYNKFLPILMEICSDDEFQTLDDKQGESLIEVQQSVIRFNSVEKPRRVFRVEVVELENIPDLSILENQFYSVNVFLNDNLVRGDIRRRFSDFDLLYEILFRKYKGNLFPAFPEKGILSYVKTKVSIAKDHEFLVKRMRMLERFLSQLLNQPQFELETNEEMRKFLSEKEFDLFKKAEKQNTQSYFSNSLNKLLGFMKIGKENKYKAITDQLQESKQEFQKLYLCIKEMKNLVETEALEYINYMCKDYAFAQNPEYCKILKKSQEVQEQNLQKLTSLEFELFCLNQDFVMVLKTIEGLDEMKNNEQNYRELDKVEKIFASNYNDFQERKKKQLKKASMQFTQALKAIKVMDEKI